jgi:hypothetical protein
MSIPSQRLSNIWEGYRPDLEPLVTYGEPKPLMRSTQQGESPYSDTTGPVSLVWKELLAARPTK